MNSNYLNCDCTRAEALRDGQLHDISRVNPGINCHFSVPTAISRRLWQAIAGDVPFTPSHPRLAALEPLQFASVRRPADSRLWNELIQRYHYLGYRPLSGAQMRYLVWSGDGRLLAALGFGACAWHLKPRDQYIGWEDGQRRRGLPRIVNNARFLILPWVHSPGLASRVLSGAIRPLLADWSRRYGYQPVLLETFVENPRFKGTSYKAANWTCVGQTQGRGKLEKQHRQACALKQIWLYPLHPHFRKILCA